MDSRLNCVGVQTRIVPRFWGIVWTAGDDAEIFIVSGGGGFWGIVWTAGVAGAFRAMALSAFLGDSVDSRLGGCTALRLGTGAFLGDSVDSRPKLPCDLLRSADVFGG